MSEYPVLYSFRRCPYAMRARMAITISETPVRLREIILRDKPEAMLKASPKGTVPVVVDGSTIIEESLEVMHWALSKNDPEDWSATNNDPLITQCDEEFKGHLDRYKYPNRYEGVDPLEHRAAGLTFLETLEARLIINTYLSGETRSFVDIAIFPFVRQFRIADMTWFDEAPIPHVQIWLKALMESSLFTSIMKKYPLWKETREEVNFPA